MLTYQTGALHSEGKSFRTERDLPSKMLSVPRHAKRYGLLYGFGRHDALQPAFGLQFKDHTGVYTAKTSAPNRWGRLQYTSTPFATLYGKVHEQACWMSHSFCHVRRGSFRISRPSVLRNQCQQVSPNYLHTASSDLLVWSCDMSSRTPPQVTSDSSRHV